ncbi:hypothetical protein Tco_0894841 [Tanacetum coccineum]|uniref:Uncharacterized protein n=1 Tax=Tanacetum coccineum TaxID=301880 RepID=A0ABQ5CE52_9ASTR
MNSNIEDDIMDPVMQCTTLPIPSSFSQKKLVSFVMEIHTTSIDFLTPTKNPVKDALPKLNLPDHSLIPTESNSLPHAHTQATKTYYKHQNSRIKKDQELNTNTSANSDIQDLPKSYQDYQDNDCQGRLLASFQDDA